MTVSVECRGRKCRVSSVECGVSSVEQRVIAPPSLRRFSYNAPVPDTYRFSFGPWNIHEGADPFGPPVRPTVAFAEKLGVYKQLGFDAIMLHDDDAVANLEGRTPHQIESDAGRLRTTLDDQGLTVEVVAPRLWEDARGIDGAFTANDPAVRRWAIDRSRRCADLCRIMGTDLLVLWLAREGTYIREAKDAVTAHQWIVDAVNAILEHDPKIRIAIEPKPNEPMDIAYIPTIGHALALADRTADPPRVGGLIETAHAVLAGLDPADEMAFAISMGKLWSVHLNDQNGLKFDQDKSFASVNLRSAFNQVAVLEEARFAQTGMIAFDVKAMRTQESTVAEKHLANSRRMFLALVEKVRTFDRNLRRQCIQERDYESLEVAVLEHLMGL